MSITLSTLHSKIPMKYFPQNPFPRIQQNHASLSIRSWSTFTNPKPLNELQMTCNYFGSLKKTVTHNACPLKFSGFIAKAQNDSGIGNTTDKEEMEARGESSMPERFRYLAKEAPDKPLRWPWLIVAAFMLYAWRTVLWELSNWKRTIGMIFQFLGYISKLTLALIFHFIGDPLTFSIRGVENAIYAIRAYYSGVIAYAPIPELTTIIMLTSAILAIGEATVPDSVNSQPYLLAFAGLIGFLAVRNYITELLFWTLLVGLFGFARLVKKRDYVSSTLPVAAVLAAVGEPWIRVIVIPSYLGLAIFHHSKYPADDVKDGIVKRVPVPLICAALAIGVRVAAKWAGYRHLTWMVV